MRKPGQNFQLTRDPRYFSNPRIRSIYRRNPQSVSFLRPNPPIRGPIHPPPYDTVFNHFSSSEQNPLRLLIMGVAGTGKSYVIDSLRNLLQTKCRVLAYTGKASFNVNEVTLHPLLTLPLGTKRN